MQVYMKWQWVVQQILDPLIHHNPFHIILNPSKATIVNLTLPSLKEDHLKCSFMPKMYGITHKGWGCNDDQKLVPLNNLNLNFSVYITIVHELYDWTKMKSSSVAGNQWFQKNGRKNSLQLSLNSHALWIILYCEFCTFLR